MLKFTVTTQVNAPSAHVFALFSDVENAAGRIKGITKIELLTPGPARVGTKFRETRVMFGKPHTETLEISALDPGRSYEIRCASCGAEYRTQFTFTPDGGGTRVDMTTSTRAVSFFARLMSPLAGLMMGAMKKCIAKDMEDLKAVAEAGKP